MQHLVTELIEHMAHSQSHLARMLEAERDITLRMAEIVHALPDARSDFSETEELVDSAQMLTQSVISYLVSLADLQETLAVHMQHIMREIRPSEDEEE